VLSFDNFAEVNQVGLATRIHVFCSAILDPVPRK